MLLAVLLSNIEVGKQAIRAYDISSKCSAIKSIENTASESVVIKDTTLWRFAQERLKGYSELLKLKLSSLVVFSAAIGHIVAAQSIHIWELLLLSFGGFAITGAANGFNQILERDLDAQMNRTSKRPLATAKVTVNEALLVTGLLSLIGVVLLASFNMLTALLGMVSLILYAFIYTPTKRISPIAVTVGAIPGALPPLIGWVAFSGELTVAAIVLFGIQFLWQFPHFWAIAWIRYEDYAKAGFYLLPTRRKDKESAFQTLLYGVALIGLSGGLMYWGVVNSIFALVGITLASVFYGYKAYLLYQHCTREAARRLMFTSFIYLPVIQVIMWIDAVWL